MVVVDMLFNSTMSGSALMIIIRCAVSIAVFASIALLLLLLFERSNDSMCHIQVVHQLKLLKA
jgi:hypothetical protein